MNTAEVLIDGLVRAGTPRIFGVPGGGGNLELLEAAGARDLPFILTHGETAACIMAAVTGELTGAPGAALTGLGPGVSSAANGVAYALLDRAPMVLVTDRHPDAALAFATHQCFDHGAVLAPVVKESLVVEAATAAHRIAHAAQLAMTEPRGPVHLDVPGDVAGRPSLPVATACRPAPLAAPSAASLDAAAEAIAAARRPVLLLGLQCRTGAEATWLRALAEALPAPVLATYKAKGVFPDPHPLALGLLTGAVLEESLLRQADLLVAVGLDPVELIPRAWSAKAPVVHLGPTTASGGYFAPAFEVVGDTAAILEELAPSLRNRASADWDVAALDRLKRDLSARLRIPSTGLAPHRVVELAREATPPGTIATVDAGAHMFAATAFWHAVAPGEFLISNGLATMGFALPAAIAAQLHHPERRVVCFTGDGGLMMAAAELETAARLRLPLIVVVFNDGALSLIALKQAQRGMTGTRLTYAGPDFVRLAESFGFRGVVADSEASFARAFEQAMAGRAPTLIDARIDATGYRAMVEAVRGG